MWEGLLKGAVMLCNFLESDQEWGVQIVHGNLGKKGTGLLLESRQSQYLGWGDDG